MATQEIAFELLDFSPWEIQRRERSANTWMIIGGGVVLSIVLFAIVVTLRPPSTAQPSYYPQPDSFTYYVPLFIAALAIMRASLFLRDWRRFRRQCATILAMRAGAALGDERIAPLAKDQLSAVLDEPLPMLPAR
jgi:hypothetical protein